MTTAQVIEMSVNVNNRRVKENTHADNHTPPTEYEMTSGPSYSKAD